MHATMRIVRASTLALAVLLLPTLLAGTGCTGKVGGKGGNDGGPGAGSAGAAAGNGGITTGDAGVTGTAGSGGKTDSGATGAAGSGGKTDSGAAGGGAGTGGTVSIFVAQGHKGRLTISCDDGKTWINDHSDNPSARCFATATDDCDHDPAAARGLGYGNGYVVATFGWGMPGHIGRSKNGIDWESFAQAAGFYADLDFGNDLFVFDAVTPKFSSDDGKTLQAGGTITFNNGVTDARAIAFTPKNGGRFVITGETGSMHDVVISKDNAKSWVHPGTLPPECGGSVTGITSSDSIVVIAQGGGRVCSSNDGGDTWVTTKVSSDGFTSPPVWTGSEFMVWQQNALFRSKDAVAWTMASITPASVHIGQVAVNKHGTFVAVNGDWQAWYDKQEFYRSTDGVSWDVLPKTAFTGSHPIYFIQAADVEASAQCPAP